MELDLHDAIRNRLVCELDFEGEHCTLEPYSLEDGPNGELHLVVYVLSGSKTGWNQFSEWSNLKISKKTFTPRKQNTI
ncbi:MAG: hypothetical protein AAGE37_10585 [Pseudomonadota bacterium]